MLLTLKGIIDELNGENIRYLHWKSNEHLDQALNGETDLDILVHPNDYYQFIGVINKHKFKKYETQQCFNYPSIDDFIGFDKNTGILIHFHVHHQLMLGKKFIKELHLPIEDYIYATSINDIESNMKIINPDLEIIILLIRFFIKYQGLLNKPSTLNNEYIMEYKWLFNRINESNVEYHATLLFGEKFGLIMKQSLSNLEDKNSFNQLRKEIYRVTKRYNKDNTLVTSMKYLTVKSKVIYKNIFVKRMKRPLPYKRTNPNSGLIIVFMGVDGSGKSTLVSFTRKWLSKKLDVFPVYFGSGDGSSSFIRYPFVLIKKIFKKKKRNTDKPSFVSNNKNKKKKRNLIYRISRSFWAILLAYEKKQKFKKVWKARSNGLIAICDRYPQAEIYGYNDGPLLTRWLKSQNKVKKRLSLWEYNIYKLGEMYKPDLIIKLEISEDVAANRKSGTPRDMIKKKIGAVKKIEIHPSTNVKVLNTEESLDVTKESIRNTIKEYL